MLHNQPGSNWERARRLLRRVSAGQGRACVIRQHGPRPRLLMPWSGDNKLLRRASAGLGKQHVITAHEPGPQRLIPWSRASKRQSSA